MGSDFSRDKFRRSYIIPVVVSILLYQACVQFVSFIREQFFIWILQHRLLRWISPSFRAIVEVFLFASLALIFAQFV